MHQSHEQRLGGANASVIFMGRLAVKRSVEQPHRNVLLVVDLSQTWTRSCRGHVCGKTPVETSAPSLCQAYRRRGPQGQAGYPLGIPARKRSAALSTQSKISRTRAVVETRETCTKAQGLASATAIMYTLAVRLKQCHWFLKGSPLHAKAQPSIVAQSEGNRRGSRVVVASGWQARLRRACCWLQG